MIKAGRRSLVVGSCGLFIAFVERPTSVDVGINCGKWVAALSRHYVFKTSL